MRWSFSVFRAVAALTIGLGLFPDSSRHNAQWSLTSAARAQTACQFPPSGAATAQACNPSYTAQVNIPKNLGAPGVSKAINFAIGNLYLSETDHVGGGPLSLSLGRFYNSFDAGNARMFGAGWRAAYSRSIAQPTGNVVKATRDDGRVFTFAGGIFSSMGGGWTSEADVNFRLTQTASGWSLITDQDAVETYNAQGRLTAFTNRAGQTQTLVYDAQGRLSTVTDPYGRRLTYSYVSPTGSLVAQVTAPDNGVYAYAYDANGRLASVTYPDASQRKYLYENAAFPNAVTGVLDAKGNREATYAYNAAGFATSSQGALGADLFTVDYAYQSQGVVATANSAGPKTSYLLQGIAGTAKPLKIYDATRNAFATNVYDANGNLTSETGFGGGVATYAYDTARNLQVSRTLGGSSPGGSLNGGSAGGVTVTTSWHPTLRLPVQIVETTKTTSFAYDARGNLLSATVASNSAGGAGCSPSSMLCGGATSTQSYSYNAAGQPLTSTDPNGRVTTYAYDARGNLASATNPLGQATTQTFDVNGRALTTTTTGGPTTTNAYDARGRLTSSTTGGLTTSYAYDAAGNRTKVVNPDGSFTSSVYDQANRLAATADALGNRTVYTLDAAGNQIRTDVYDAANALIETRSAAYDALGRKTQDKDAAGNVTAYSYDANGNLLTATTPLGARTSNVYDSLSRKTQTTDALNGVTKFAYDSNSAITSQTDPLNHATTYAYDGLGRVTTLQSPDTGATTSTYDAAGNLLTTTDARGKTTTHVYDALNRRTKTAYADGTSVVWLYDQGANAAGKLTSITDATGSLTYGYDALKRVVAATQVTGAVSKTVGYSYDAAGRASGVTYPSGAVISYAYDAAGRVSGMTLNGQPLISGVAYRGPGAVSAWTAANGSTYSRAYNQDGRLASLAFTTSSGGYSRALAYDPAGRIVGMSETGLPAKSFAYDALDRLTGYASGTTTQSYSYDANGNRRSFSTNAPSAQSFAYGYDPASNRLLSLSGSWSENFAYDASGNIVSHNTPSATYAFTYDAKNRLSQSLTGAIPASYGINGLGLRVSKTDAATPGGRIVYVYDENAHLIGEYDGTGALIEETVWLGDLPVAVLRAGGVLYVAPDQLGAPWALIGGGAGASQIAWLWDHDPFGNGAPSAAVGVAYNPRFPGQYYDALTGLHYNGARDYNPKLGRYIESDPIGLQGGLNTYAYVGGNPISNIDKDGRFFQLVGAASEVCAIFPLHCAAVAAGTVWLAEKIIPTTPLLSKPALPDARPDNFCEQLALEEAKAGAGYQIPPFFPATLGDEPRLIAHYGAGPWIKKEHKHTCFDGRELVIHYFSNGQGLNVELKFK
ncbi:RHS repeat-associated core domain-containing protein [Methylocystis sp. JAN1]|uniref:RHS repeat-associated core domain-containing protein n=1 Tax=Methylocystis sp. JAN1 TaxID=3397211 RepID=UPI003FA2C45E